MSLTGRAATDQLITGQLAVEKTIKGKTAKLSVIYSDAYTIAVQNGYKGTVEEWLADIKGEKGDVGPQGEKGEQGETGPQGIQGDKGDKGDPGPQGERGERGETGAAGAKGDPGADGKTPVKGIDYFTEEDKKEIAAQAAGVGIKSISIVEVT